MIDLALPAQVFDHDISTQLMKALPEFKKVCGADTELGLIIDFRQDGVDPWVKLSAENGIVFGDPDSTILILDILVSNASVTNRSMVQIEMNIEIDVGLNITDLIVHLSANNARFANSKVTKDEIDMYAHNFARLFQAVFEDKMVDFHLHHRHGLPISQITGPDLAPIVDAFKNSYMTPATEKGWMFVGVSAPQ